MLSVVKVSLHSSGVYDAHVLFDGVMCDVGVVGGYVNGVSVIVEDCGFFGAWRVR